MGAHFAQKDFMESLRTFLTDLNLGPWPTAGLIILASIVLAQLTAFILTRVLARMARRPQTTLDDDALRILHRPIFTTVLLVGLWVADLQLHLGSQVEAITVSALTTVGILVWLAATFKLTNLFLGTGAPRTGRPQLFDQQTLPLYNNLIKIGAVAAAIYLVITAWHIDATAWLASAGIVGIKDTLANLFSGVFILADAPYKVGDYVNLDAGERGEVTHIGLRSTRILTRDDIEVTVPNAVIGNAKIINETGGRWSRRRLRVPIGVAYGSDIDKVREVLAQAAEDCEFTCSDPTPLVRFRQFGNSSLDFELLVWIEEPVVRGRALDALNTSIYKEFAKAGIQIPFPQRDLHIKSMPKSDS
jgi:small-conductance mechanosensitive channel